MRLLIALTLLLLNTPQATTHDGCTCGDDAVPAICITKDSGLAPTLKTHVTLQLHGGSSRQLSAELSRLTGREVLYLPSRPGDAINLDVKNAPLWDVLEILSQSGQVQLEGRDFAALRTIRKALAAGEKVSVCVENAPVRQVVGELAGLSGQTIRIASGDEKALVTLSAQGVTLKGILSWISTQAGVQIVVR